MVEEAMNPTKWLMLTKSTFFLSTKALCLVLEPAK